jgi:hypothetical protein
MRNEVTFMRSQLTAEQQAKLALEDQLTSEMQVSNANSACLVWESFSCASCIILYQSISIFFQCLESGLAKPAFVSLVSI